ncbi:MAG: DUF3515 family protein [Actinobacteria bacterium]|nr:DUF3515 family protein [Actinomycetota bacterium]
MALFTLGVATGCAGSVAVPVPNPEPTGLTAQACTDLDGALPSSVLDQVRRPTEPQSIFTSAYGNSPITVRCGVAVPASLTATSLLATINGIDWLPEQRSAGYVFTTIGRVANVEVAVPDAFAPETDVLVDLSPSIEANIPLQAAQSPSAD